MTSTELTHSSQAINMLIDAIVTAVGEDYDVAEIEGDAVLLIRKGAAPSKKEIKEICLRIFNAFHFQLKWMQQHAVCPCGACQCLINLSLKFVVHHGPVAEIKIGRFVKQSGIEMIIAHRLLKNSINNNEYLLVSDKLLNQFSDLAEPDELEWTSSSEEYSSIGKIGYQFTLLNNARKNVPDPPELKNQYRADDTAYLEIPVAASFRDVYMAVMNIPGRVEWVPELQKVEQDIPQVFVGSIHYCSFQNYQCVVSPLWMTVADDNIGYAESCHIGSQGISLVYEYVFNKVDEKRSRLSYRFLNVGNTPLSDEMNTILFKRMDAMVQSLVAYCGKIEVSLFEPAF
jgi:hypothetical protein